MDSLKFDRLINYIEQKCDGCSVHEFWLDGDQPDMDAARQFAEGMRAQLGERQSIVSVRQSNNVVRMRLQMQPCCTDVSR